MAENNVATFSRTVQQRGSGSSIHCNIPSEARDFLGLTAGTDVTVHLDLQKGRVIIEPEAESEGVGE